MAQTAHIWKEIKENSKKLEISNASVAVAQAGTTSLIEVKLYGIANLFIQVSNTSQALDAFTIQAKCHPDATYATIFSVAADYTSPAGIMIGSNGTDLTTLAAGSSGWVMLDVRGLDSIKVLASSAHADGSITTIYAGGA